VRGHRWRPQKSSFSRLNRRLTSAASLGVGAGRLRRVVRTRRRRRTRP
jgi:hypothetical protein